LYYNKTFFEKNNLTVPVTWNELETLCEAIKAIDPNCIPFTYDSEANWFITLTEQLNSGYTSLDGEKFVFDTETNRMFVEELRELYKRGYITTSAVYGGYTSDLFTQTEAYQQKCYMCVGSSAGASYHCPAPFADDGGNVVYPFEVGVAMIPQFDQDNQKVVQQGPSLCMFKKANSQEMAAAWLFTKYLATTVEFQGEFSMTNGYMPVIQSAYEHPVYENFLDRGDGFQYLQATAIKQAIAQKDYYFASPAFNGSSAARKAVGDLMINCFIKNMIGNQSVTDFIRAEFATAINTLRADYGN
jgi:multiple sugar transport system substrate-binding protein